MAKAEAQMKTRLLLEHISVPAFASFLAFLYNGHVLSEAGKDNDSNIRNAELSIDLCAIADKWRIPNLHNEAVKTLSNVVNQLSNDDTKTLANKAYMKVSESSPLCKYMTMRIAYNTFSAPKEFEVFIRDVDYYLRDKKQHPASEYERKRKCGDYHEELVNLVRHNVELGKDFKLGGRKDMESIPIEHYLLK
jgi:hypothetical protein